MPKSRKELTDKQQAFVEHYCTDAKWNATKAALLAGYSKNCLRQLATDTLSKPYIKKAIELKKQELREDLKIDKQWCRDKHLELMNLCVSKADMVNSTRNLEDIGKIVGAYGEDNAQKRTQTNILIDNRDQRRQQLRKELELLDQADNLGDGIDRS